jgi:acyl carrier protein
MEELIKILEQRHPDVDFTECDELITQNILTSLDIVSIIAEISDVFDVRIPPLEIRPENFNSAVAMYALITRLADE